MLLINGDEKITLPGFDLVACQGVGRYNVSLAYGAPFQAFDYLGSSPNLPEFNSVRH
jgi:hypothetical protein